MDKLQAILADLYKLDPELRTREDELVVVIEALLRAQPETTFDARFAAQLRQKLLSQPVMTSSVFHKFALISLGGLIALVIAVPLTYELAQPGGSLPEFSLSDVSAAPTINSVGDRAFGTLDLSTASAAPTAAEAQPAAVPSGQGGGAVTAPMPMSADASSNGRANLAIEPYPGQIEYVYSYTGDDLDLSQISDAVYKANGGLDIGNAGGDLARAKFGPVDLGAFHDLKLQSFGLTQSDNNGYSVYVDPTSGSVSINGNQGLWNYGDGTYTPLTDAQVLSDDQVIAIADAFLKTYGIDTSAFGEPVVDERNLMYARMQPVGIRYLPDAMNVTYPLLLEGQPAFAEDGSAYGLSVSVNMRNQQVTNANLNVASAYDKSSYELERDTSKILGLAEQGGLYTYPADAGAQKITIELGTPQLILVNHSTYDNNTWQTLFIPALSFPITKNSDTNPVYNNSIVIPLVKSVIEQAGQTNPIRPFEDTVKTP